MKESKSEREFESERYKKFRERADTRFELSRRVVMRSLGAMPLFLDRDRQATLEMIGPKKAIENQLRACISHIEGMLSALEQIEEK